MPSLCCPSEEARNERVPPAVQSCQEGSAEGYNHCGSHRRSRRPVARGMLGGGDLGKQVVQGPGWTDPLCSQETPVGPCHCQEAPRSPSTRRRSRHSSFTFKSNDPLADSWSQDTEKQPRGMRGKLPIWWANSRKWMDGGCSDFLNKIALRTCVFPCPLEPALSLLSYHRRELHTRSHSCFTCKSRSQEVLPKAEGTIPRDSKMHLPASFQISASPPVLTVALLCD